MTSVEYTKTAPGSAKSVRLRVRQAVHINGISHQAPERTWRCGMKKNEFRINEVPPGSVLLMGDGRCSTSKWGLPLHGSKFNVRPGAALEARRRVPSRPTARRSTAKLGASTFRWHLLSEASDV